MSARGDGGLYLGLNSGTSADRIDAALVRLPDGGKPFRARVLGRAAVRLPPEMKETLLRSPDGITARELTAMDAALGALFGRAAQRAMRAAGVRAERVRAAGLHGQTVCHLPAARGRSATLQIGSPERVAMIAGVPVVSGFRQADVAAGGEGAPLSPALDLALFADAIGALVLNLGGIANLTAIPAGARREDVRGFDVGPGNMLLDGIARRRSLGSRGFDPGGRTALRGAPSRPLLERALAHPFLARRRARSTGREEFGDSFLRGFLADGRALGLGPEEMLATAAALTAEAAWRSFHRDVGPGRWGRTLWICGGGVKNAAVVRELRARFGYAGYRVRPLRHRGVSAADRECVLFAFLAREFVGGRPANLPSVTGAARSVVLGRWTPRPATRR